MARVIEIYAGAYASGKSETALNRARQYAQLNKPITLVDLDTVEPAYTLRPIANDLRKMGIKIGSSTGYTDAMMDIVVKGAAKEGYSPDFWISPDGVGGKGRPYPYMIFENMKVLGVSSVKNVVKVGDTVSDIREGVSAGVWSVGVIEGSSELGLTQEEFEQMSPEQKEKECCRVEQVFRKAGADFVIDNLSQLPALIRMLGK